MSGVYWGLVGTVGTQGPQGVLGHQGALGAPRGLLWDIRGMSGCIGVASGLGCQPHWVPVQGPNMPTGSCRGVTYLAKAKQVTEMSSAGYYTHLELYFVTVFTFVSMPTSSHILTHNIKKCYMDYFLCRPIYTYPYTINLMYYDTMVTNYKELLLSLYI